MSLYLLDTDHLALYSNGHARLLQNLSRHASDRFCISVITVEEQLTGWQRALNQARDDARRVEVYRRLAASAQEFGNWRVLDFPMTAFVRYKALTRQRLNVGSYDLMIGAIALEFGATVLTRNLRDFRRIPALACEDWSV